MMSRGNRRLAKVFVVAGVLAAWYFVYTAWDERDEAQRRTQARVYELSAKQQVLANHDAYLAQLREMEPVLAHLMHRLPSRFDVAVLEHTLRHQAEAAGIEIGSLRFAKERPKEFYAELRAELVVQGPATGLVTYLDDVLRDSPAREVASMEIAPLDDAKGVRAKLALTYWRYAEEDEMASK